MHFLTLFPDKIMWIIMKNKLGLIFSLLYGLFSLIILNADIEGSWGGFILFILALPFSFISLLISNYFNNFIGNLLFILINMLWYYFFGWLLSKIFLKK